MRAGLDGMFFGWKSKGIPAHRMQDVSPLHPCVTADDISGRVALRMSHMQTAARRVRKHVEHIQFGLLCRVARRNSVLRAKRLVRFPRLLPVSFNTFGVITRHNVFSSIQIVGWTFMSVVSVWSVVIVSSQFIQPTPRFNVVESLCLSRSRLCDRHGGVFRYVWCR